MKIYFETKQLQSLTQFMNISCPRMITNNGGYRAMINDASICIKNGWDIYTNELALLGSSKLFGDKFMHKIMVRNASHIWVEFNQHILKKLSKPILIEEYFRRYICN